MFFSLCEFHSRNSENVRKKKKQSRATTNSKAGLMGEKNNLSYVIIAIDHIYEDDIKLQTVLIQKKRQLEPCKSLSCM